MSGIGETFLSATLEPLIKQLGSEAIKFLTNHKKVRSSFKKLSGSLAHIKGVLQDAEEQQYAEASMKQWLVSLRDAAYDLEDLLDEIQIQAEKRRRRKVISKLFNTPSTMILDAKMMSEIDDITRRLEDIEKQVLKLGIVKGGVSGIRNRKDAASVSKPHMLQDPLIVGRDEKKKEIIDMVCGSKDDLLVLPIVGMGGIGKTTLAKSVYYDTQVQQHFDTRAMATVSTEFDMLEVTRKIYRDVINKEPKSKDLDTLQRELETELVNKKFLIVLDDVWNDKSEDWENLICPFKKCQSGSVIIVTTRSEEIAKKVNPHLKPLKLALLNEEDCLSLMLHHAQISFNDTPEFEDVAMKLMRRCGGLPLAARALGGILVSKGTVEEWERVLNNKIWKSDEENIMRVLRLSYFDLPPHLKRMFAYCSIFPQDYIFHKKQLVLLWMGEGFLDQHVDTDMQTKEDRGHECFDELLKKSFFQYSSHRETYVMHDLVNDLAHLIAAETCDRWDRKSSLEKVRHCSILTQDYEISNKFKNFPQAKGLRTLIFLENSCFMSNKILPDLLPKLRHIRVLSLRRCEFTELPDSICELTHLRYLDLSWSGIRTLPNSLDRLIWLETLSISQCHNISCLPKTLGNLCYLRHLDNFYTRGLKYIPSEIGKLEHLQTLSKVVLSKEGGFGLKELQNLKNLGGSLAIEGLENVTSVKSVEECLKFIKNLHRLELKWNMRNEFISDEDVLDCLHPHRDLRELAIKGFGGSRFPSWVGDHSYTKLSSVSLEDCGNCTCLPPLGQLPNLKKLKISRMDNITCIGDELYGHGGTSIPFSKLESLSLMSMRNLRKWCISGTDDGHVFSHMKSLEIDGCKKLEDVSLVVLESLQDLSFRNCSGVLLKSFRALSSLTYFGAWHISGLCHLPYELVQSFSSLEQLSIFQCDELETLWPEDATLQHLIHLKTIRIYECKRLRCLGHGNQHLPCNLQDLRIDGCGALVSLDLSYLNSCTHLSIRNCNKLSIRNCNKLPSSLKSLSISLESLIQQISGFQSLVSLNVSDCHTIEQLPSLPPNLTSLRIESWAALRSLPSDISFSSMESLVIKDCSELDNFPSFVFPSKLSRLQVRRSGKLKPLNEWGLQRLLNLREFSITGGFPELRQLNNTCLFPTSLNELTIEGFPMLVSLENVLENLNALQRLTISMCEKLGKLPSEGVLENLHRIHIFECSSLRIKYSKDLADYLKNKVGIPEVVLNRAP